jgi:hypothetical protein
MAEDLTPRDDVRAEIVPDDDATRAPAPAAPVAARPDGAPPYQARFQLIFGILLGVAMAAVAATALFLTVGKNSNGPSVEWSTWHPTGSDGLAAVNQIADHVGQRYTLPSGNQLVAVHGGPLELGGLPVTVAVRDPAPNSGKISVLDSKGVLFTLCGLGKYCSIKEGKPSVARHLVLRRESLELALYTFRYIKNVDEVVIMLPPAPGDKPSEAMFFRRGEVGGSLSRPLAATLPGPPPSINRLGVAQANFLNRLTGANLYGFEAVQGQDAKVYLVLQKPTTP